MQHRLPLLRLFVFGFALLQSLWAADPPLFSGQEDTYPFAPPAGVAGSSAIAKDDSRIVGWASGYTDLVYGSDVSPTWQTPTKALGPAVGDSFDVVSLGQSGRITLTLTHAISDGAGPDFAVFENAFSDTFLELAWVEVSTDGEHFLRFPNLSYTDGPTGSLDATNIYGYAGKYRQGYGTPFDLEQLELAHQAASSDSDAGFSGNYKQHLLDNYPHVDLGDIRYVRILDILGDGTAHDIEGLSIYDPYPTTGSAGFDLEALAVINRIEPNGLPQSIDFPEVGHQRLGAGSLRLEARASSGLSVSYDILEGPASIEGDRLQFTGLGQVAVRASQAGDVTYAKATPVVRSFHIADELQHIYFEPVANQVTNTSVDLHAATSSGLTPVIEVVSGPSDVSAGFPPDQVLQTGATTGEVVVRAYQVGGTVDGVTYAPAREVAMALEVVSPDSEKAPLSFEAWQSAHSISGSKLQDSDADGASDFEEYVGAKDPLTSSERPLYLFEKTEGANDYILEVAVSELAPVRVRVEANSDLHDGSGWTEVVPEILEIITDSPERRKLRLRVSSGEGARKFWRFSLDAN